MSGDGGFDSLAFDLWRVDRSGLLVGMLILDCGHDVYGVNQMSLKGTDVTTFRFIWGAVGVWYRGVEIRLTTQGELAGNHQRQRRG